jgi:Isocitrate dehydrogenases
MSDYLEKIKSQIPNLQAYAGKYADPIEGEYVVYTGPGQLKVPDRLVVGYIEGDGTGPEVAYAAIKVANARRREGVRQSPQGVVVRGPCGLQGGEAVGEQVAPTRAWRSSRRSGCYLKAPLETPVGGGFRSLNRDA